MSLNNTMPNILQRKTALLFCFFCLHACFSTAALAQTEYEAPKLNCVRNISAAPAGTELNWSLPLTPNPCFTGYEIYGSTGDINGPYSLITTIANPAQTSVQINPPAVVLSTGTLATVTYFYMINRGSCNNPSPPANKTSDTLANETRQPYTVIQNASVINGQVHLSWYPAHSPEVTSYLVYNDQDGFTTPDTVYGRLNTTYIDTVNDPNVFPIRYKIRTLEYCEDPAGQQGAITPDSADHRTMLLQVGTPDKCTQTASLSWQPYKIGGAQVVNYEIQKSINGGPFAVDGTSTAATTNYLLQNIPFHDTVCVRINAILPNGTSALSNERCFSADVIQKPVNDYIRNISVENGSIVIEYRKDTSAAPPRVVKLYRSNDGILFDPLTDMPLVDDFYSYIFKEDNLPVNDQIYYYQVTLIDSCYNSHSSDTAETLRIGIKVKSNNRAELQWTGFELDNVSFDHFRLEKIKGTDTFTVGTFNRTETSYLEDSLFDYNNDSVPGVCYRVTAVFTNNNDAAPRETLESHSNIICVEPEPQAFVPNAFAPAGVNRNFKPFLLFAKPDNYDFKIFDRWYRLLFSTNDVNASWDGYYKGSPEPLDSYIYLIHFTGKNDQTYTQSGTVMLLR